MDPRPVRRRAREQLAFGTIDAWLAWKLTGGAAHVTDLTNASRTMLVDLGTGSWDDELLELFSVGRSVLPAIVPLVRHGRGGLAASVRTCPWPVSRATSRHRSSGTGASPRAR